MLYDVNGGWAVAKRYRPEPNPETEARVREQLQNLDSLLDIKWFPTAIFNQRDKDFEGRYALVCKWPQGDPRWEYFQKQEIEFPYDRLGWFCTDVQDPESVPVSPDAIERKVMELLAKCDGEKTPHLKRMAQVVEKNSRVTKDRQKEILEQTEDVARNLHYISGHVEETTLNRIFKEVAEEGQKDYQ
jgi:hypothetical protein